MAPAGPHGRAATAAAWTVLCALRSPHANDGVMTVRRKPLSGGGDVREVVLDWTTNEFECAPWHQRPQASGPGGNGVDGDGGDDNCWPHSGQPVTDSRSCSPCPCAPDFRLARPRASSYGVDMCSRVATAHSCAFSRAVVVGLGTGFLSGCLAHHCPRMRVDTVDVDADVLTVANAFFGWGNRTAVSLVGAERHFRELADRMDAVDLVIIDCFSRHGVPHGCRSPALLASVRRVLRPASPGGPMLFAVNVFGGMVAAYRGNFTRALGRPDSVVDYRGQWLTINTHRRGGGGGG